MRLPLFTGYPDGSITGNPSKNGGGAYVPTSLKKKFKVYYNKQGILTIKIRKS